MTMNVEAVIRSFAAMRARKAGAYDDAQVRELVSAGRRGWDSGGKVGFIDAVADAAMRIERA